MNICRVFMYMVLAALPNGTGHAQDLKALAKIEFQNENYPAAVNHLESFVASNPSDPEAWEQLAKCLHFRSYDSTPPIGYDLSVSNRILFCLQKVLSLDPTHRDCYDLLGSEYGARATFALQAGDWEGFLEQLTKAQDAGAFPEWLLEYAENVLKSSNQGAILFTGGDAEVFPVWYCQFIRGIRTDVTLAPVTLLDRPWFLSDLKSGMSPNIPALPIPWTHEQIMGIHPFKWTKRDVELEVPVGARSRYTTSDTTFTWCLSPDMEREGRTFLSVSRAVIKDVIIANKWERPIHFTYGCHQWMLANLDEHLRLCAMTRELVPFHVKRCANDIALEATSTFLNDPGGFQRLASVREEDLPGSSALLTGYRVLYLRTCGTLLHIGEVEAALGTLKQMEANIPEEILPMSEGWQQEVTRLRDQAQTVRH